MRVLKAMEVTNLGAEIAGSSSPNKKIIFATKSLDQL
jgi:hypothetical protein